MSAEIIDFPRPLPRYLTPRESGELSALQRELEGIAMITHGHHQANGAAPGHDVIAFTLHGSGRPYTVLVRPNGQKLVVHDLDGRKMGEAAALRDAWLIIRAVA